MLGFSEKEVKARISFDNPWWETGKIETRFSDLPRRSYFDPFYQLSTTLEINRAVVLMGPRRVGKTVLIHQTISNLLNNNFDRESILYVSIETPIYTGHPLQNILDLFMQIHGYDRDKKLYIFFDEIQYLKDWEIHLKSLVDSYPSCQFVVTGSAAAALRLKAKESGAGRFTEFLLPPLTFAEYLSFTKKEDELVEQWTDEETHRYLYKAKDIDQLNQEFVNYLNYGGYPEAVFSKEIQNDSSRFIKSDIIDKVLLRDLPSLYGIKDIQELNRLFTTLAYNTGNEVSLETLSSSSDVAKNTLKKYLEYLEAAFLIRVVRRVDCSAKHFKRTTTFKVYLTNPSMRAALFGPIDPDATAMGALTETAIYSQWLHGEQIDWLYYARWKNGEVDIVSIHREGKRPDFCIEVKWSDLAYSDNRKIKSLLFFAHSNKIVNNCLVTTKTLSGEKQVEGVLVEYRPSSEYAYLLGKNILRHKKAASLYDSVET